MTSILQKIRRGPLWLYDRFRWDVLYRLQQESLKRRRYDYAGLWKIVADLTDVSREEAEGYYRELFSRGVLEELREKIVSTPGLESENPHIRHLGPEKYFRLDRTMLYCLVRAIKPKVFLETGTRWGVGAYFIARALDENGDGRLYTFDIGVEGSAAEYGWPQGQTEIGFILPERLRQFVTFVQGDALQTLPRTLDEVGEADMYYFDSLQTYEHMTAEYKIVYPRMRAGGLFMSEDTDKNSAWDDFVRDKGHCLQARYCSHFGISTEREVSVLRIPQTAVES